MAIDPTLWEALHRAKNDLFAAFQTDLTQTTSQVLLQKPADRYEAQLVIQKRKNDLDEELNQLILVDQELLALRGLVVKALASVQSSLSPIGALPVELLVDIFTRVAEPRDHHAILTMASVCEQWRSIMHGVRSLWSDVDWNTWPLDLLQVWCSRAGEYPMTVRLGTKRAEYGIKLICDSPDFARLLQSTKQNWDVLEVDMGAAWGGVNETWCRDACAFLFKDTLPSLSSLYFVGPRPTHFDLPVESLVPSIPHVHTLVWEGAFPLRIPEPLLHLRSILLSPCAWPHWWALMPVLASSPSLDRMTINYNYLAYLSL